MSWHPCCCETTCEECCADFTEPTDVIVDVGSLNLNNGVNCGTEGNNDCTDITGEYILEADDVPCIWTNFPPVGSTCDSFRQFWFRLERRVSGSQCYWWLHIEISNFGMDPKLVVEYESTPKTFVENDCTLVSPITLSLELEILAGVCTGSFNSTITIEAV